VCGGDNSTCADCAGTPHGNAKVDKCNVCNGDSSTCCLAGSSANCPGCDGVKTVARPGTPEANVEAMAPRVSLWSWSLLCVSNPSRSSPSHQSVRAYRRQFQLDNIDQVKTDSSRFTVLSVWGATTSGAVNGHLIAIRVALRPKMLTENAGADLVQLALEAWGTDVVACPDLMRKWGNALGMCTGDRKGARHPAQGAGCTGAHSAPPLRP
jgi:hypothetical protein